MSNLRESASQFNTKADSAVRQTIVRFMPQSSTLRMLVLLAVSFSFFAVLRSDVFLNPVNLQNIMLSAPEIGILAVAMMLAMATGGIDLSIVAIANLSAITMSTMYTAIAANNPEQAESLFPVIVLVGVLVGGIAGFLNSLLISRVGITPILATLGTMQIFNGVAVAWTGGKTLYGSPSQLSAIGTSTVAGIPVLFVIFAVVAAVIALFLTRSKTGLQILLQGANPTAAIYSGISARSVLTSTYVTTGLLAGVAGVLFLARNPTASADYGASYVLLAIVIAVLGGTNPTGGFASVIGVVLATVTLQVVSSGFTAMRLSAYDYSMAQGLILIAVMVIDQIKWKPLRRAKRASQEPVSSPA